MDEAVVADVADLVDQAVRGRLVDERKTSSDGFVERRRDERKREVTPDDGSPPAPTDGSPPTHDRAVR